MGLRRCRNLYTLVIVVAGLFYINWLLNVTDWSRLEKFEKKIRKLSVQQDTLEFELFEAFEQENTIQTNGHFMLIGVKNIPNYHEKIFNKDQLTLNDLGSIYNILYSSQAFLIDINVLEKLIFDEIGKESVFQQNKVRNASSVDVSDSILSNKKHHLLTFGIKFQNFNRLNKVNAKFLSNN